MKWAVGLSKFNIIFKIRTAIKEYALADFVVEFTFVPKMEEEM